MSGSFGPMGNMLRYLVIACAMAFASHSVMAQESDGGGKSAGLTKKQQEKIQAKKAKNDKKEVAREEKRLLKLHLSHQDKATRKRMKRNKRNAANGGSGTHRDPFLRRLFHRKH